MHEEREEEGADDVLACDKRIRSLLQVIYDLGETEIKALILLCMGRELRVSDISKRLRKDRSTIQKALKDLTISGLVFKEPRCCRGPKKGRYFVYSVVPSENLRGNLRRRLEEWYRERLSAIEHFEWPREPRGRERS